MHLKVQRSFYSLWIGSATTTATVGSSLFGASSQASSSSKSIFSAASKATPSKSIFGGARQTPTHPVFGGSSQSLQPTSSSTLFGVKSDQSSSKNLTENTSAKNYYHLLSQQKNLYGTTPVLRSVLSSIYIICVFVSGSTFGGLGAGAPPPPPPPYGGQSGTPIFGGPSDKPVIGGKSGTADFGDQSSSPGPSSSVFGEKKSSTGERKTVFESVASTATPTELFKR